MKIAFKNRGNIQLVVIPTCSESFFKHMFYKERFPTSPAPDGAGASGNDTSIRRIYLRYDKPTSFNLNTNEGKFTQMQS